MRPSLTFLVASLWTDFYVKDSGQFFEENPTDLTFMRAPECPASLQLPYSGNHVQH